MHTAEEVNHPEDTAIINTHAPNVGASKYIKQILTGPKGETDNNIIIVEISVPTFNNR